MLAGMRHFVALLTIIAASANAAEAPLTKHFDIRQQSLASALNEFARQSDRQILFSTEAANTKQTKGVVGDLAPEAALKVLLKGTGLTFRTTADNTILVEQPKAAQTAGTSKNSQKGGDDSAPNGLARTQDQSSQGNSARAGAKSGGSTATTDEPDPPILEQVVITGTHIRGQAQVGSHVTVYTQDEIRRSGSGTIEEFASRLPQNVSSVSALAAAYGNNSGGIDDHGANFFGGAGFNIHGLGPGATLTLVDGQRVASGGGVGHFVDVSLIPLSAVDRIEILTDGASAIYGADAIAGVVNIVLKHDFHGAETAVRYASPTSGGGAETNVSQLLGVEWTTGNAMLVYDYDRQIPLLSTDRSFVPDQGEAVDLTPSQKRHSVLMSARQELETATTLSMSGSYSTRDFSQLDSTLGFPVATAGGVKQYGGGIDIDQRLGGTWRVDLSASLSTSRQSAGQELLISPPFRSTSNSDLTLKDINLIADGSLLDLPAGEVKGALGTERRNEYLSSPENFSSQLSRQITSAYAEVEIPVVGQRNSLPGVQSLALSTSARYDHYNDSGSSTNPRAGFRWSPLNGLNIRGTYARSFRAPLLSDLAYRPLYYTNNVLDAASATGYTDTLVNQSGGVDALHPEKSTSYTAGFDVHPATIPGLTVEATYFHTDFRDRITAPPLIGSVFSADIFAQPALAPYIQRNPPPASIQPIFASAGFLGDLAGGGVNAVGAIFNDSLTNIAVSKEAGIDLQAHYAWATEYGRWSTLFSATYLQKNDFAPASASAHVALLDLLGEPLKFKDVASASWSKNGWSASLSINYAKSYTNPVTSPPSTIGSLTTFDAGIGYSFDRTSALQGLSLMLTANNLFDRDPPRVLIPPAARAANFNVGFDAVNASPFGRTLAIRIIKAWP